MTPIGEHMEQYNEYMEAFYPTPPVPSPLRTKNRVSGAKILGF